MSLASIMRTSMETIIFFIPDFIMCEMFCALPTCAWEIWKQRCRIKRRMPGNITGWAENITGNAPACYLEAIRYGGFDVLVNANNHNCDSGAEGLYDTLESLDRYGFMHTGTFRSPREERFLLICVNGIRMAVLSYATYFNRLEGNFTEKGRQEMLNLYSREKAAADIAQARNKGAEFILVYIHWGKEYTHEPNEEQRQLAEELAESGADYIVGSHTHCLQRRDTVTARDGRTIPVVYSMGNFITGERKEISKHTGILQLTLQKHGGKIVVTNEAFIPCYVFEQIGSSRLAPVPTEYLLNKGVVSKKLEDARRYIEPIMRLPIVQTAAVSGEELCGLLGQTAAVDVRAGRTSIWRAPLRGRQPGSGGKHLFRFWIQRGKYRNGLGKRGCGSDNGESAGV